MLHFEVRQDLSIILWELVERAVQVDPLLVHDDGDDVMPAASRCLLDVAQLHC